ncbi:MAG TPA: tetratricopeptide repeat protein, partial [bacterium]
ELNPNHSEAQKRMMGQVVVSASSISSAPPSSPTPKTAETIGKIPVSGVMDLEQEITNPPVVTAKPLAHVPGLVVEGPDEELKAQISIAENYVKQGLVEEAIEIYQQLIESYPDHPEIKQKLNQAYTAYVKTGDDIIGALEAEKRVKEDDEKRLRQEMEKKTHEAARLKAELDQKNRLEAEKKVRSELEKKAREEAEKKADEEIERLAKEGVLKKAREEAERKVREETEKKAKTELEKRVWEEMSKKEKEESERKTQEEKAHKKQTTGPSELTTSKTGLPSKGESVGDEGRDEFMTIAVADIYTRRGLYEEASKIYRYILKIEPDNLEARKKLSDLESLMKFKGSGASPPPEPPPASAQPSPGPSRPPKGPEKDSDGKKKSSRVGYV